MNLDDLDRFRTLDKQDMLGEIDRLPDQLQTAWQLGQVRDLPEGTDVRQVLIAGMGGSAIGADLLVAYVAPECRVPVQILREYDLPAWAKGEDTLVIASSHSGNTEETLSAYQQAVQRGCQLMVITTGGELAARAIQDGAKLWQFSHPGQPRAAVGYSFGLLLAAFSRLGFIKSAEEEIAGAVANMKQQQNALHAATPVARNPAKRQAGQLMNRWVTVIGPGLLAPVARRWKCQINELASAWGQFEFIPELNHNTLSGILNPEEHLSDLMVLFVQGSTEHPRNQLRVVLTRKIFMLQGIGTDIYHACGDTRLAQQWTALHFGDYLAYYLAMAYGVDPTPVEMIRDFKQELTLLGSAEAGEI